MNYTLAQSNRSHFHRVTKNKLLRLGTQFQSSNQKATKAGNLLRYYKKYEKTSAFGFPPISRHTVSISFGISEVLTVILHANEVTEEEVGSKLVSEWVLVTRGANHVIRVLALSAGPIPQPLGGKRKKGLRLITNGQ
jgi:hypothetical protein